MATLRLLWQEYRSTRQHRTPFSLWAALKAIGIALHARHSIRKCILDNHWERRPILVYSYWFTEAVSALSLLKTTFPQLRIVSRAHGSELYSWCWKHDYQPMRFLRLQGIDRICPCSEHGRNFLLADGCPSHVVERSYLGVPPASAICPSSPKGQLHLVSCCFIDDVKRMPLLVDSLHTFAKKHSELRIYWHHLGDGTDFDRFCRAVQSRLGDLPNLTYTLHGRLTPAQVRRFMSGTRECPLDALVSVSESEGLPVSMMEAQMAGLPVIGTDVGGVSELVTSSTGVLLPKDFSHEDFIAACLSLSRWKNEPARADIAERARTCFSQDNNYTRFVREILQKQIDISRSILHREHNRQQ